MMQQHTSFSLHGTFQFVRWGFLRAPLGGSKKGGGVPTARTFQIGSLLSVVKMLEAAVHQDIGRRITGSTTQGDAVWRSKGEKKAKYACYCARSWSSSPRSQVPPDWFERPRHDLNKCDSLWWHGVLCTVRGIIVHHLVHDACKGRVNSAQSEILAPSIACNDAVLGRYEHEHAMYLSDENGQAWWEAHWENGKDVAFWVLSGILYRFIRLSHWRHWYYFMPHTLYKIILSIILYLQGLMHGLIFCCI